MSNGHAEGHEIEVAVEGEEDGGLDMVNVSDDDAAFDKAVGCIEDIVVGTQFQATHILRPIPQWTLQSTSVTMTVVGIVKSVT